MSHTFDLAAYLHRIGYDAPVKPDLSTLRALVAAHVAAIPFENLDPLLGVPVVLEPALIEKKLVQSGRGGYCFEQNALLRGVLSAIGFEVVGLIARVLWGREEDAITAQSHMLLRIELEGASWLVDVGFGGQTLTGALKLEADTVQPSAHEPYRLIHADGVWRMQSLVRDTWSTLYRFDLQPRYPIDYVVANHYSSTYPESHFLHSLVVARSVPGRRLALRNRDFVVHHLGGESVRRTLRDAAEIREVLGREFLIRVPDHPLLDQRLDALPMPE
ncbi:arylamine N-acetyltransferase family protein [Dyella subtropica]|uniref:arylamine N-acetyltransferase family protein n=1 Tax=Dyella subtropica TaxID=2992127 RepID=UPI00224E08F3|nr:arylamine N-acetyltransferase [Dyella subtropica]